MAEKKTVWLVNQYAMPPQYESRLRTIKFAQYLQTKGYEVTIFASSIMHNMDIDLIEGDEPYIECDYDDLHFVHIKAKRTIIIMVSIVSLVHFSSTGEWLSLLRSSKNRM